MKTVSKRTWDKDLWNNFLSGDCGSFDQIYNDYMPILFNYAKKFTRDKVLIEDIIQDLFVDLWYKRRRLGTTNNIKLYLFKSLRRRVLRTLQEEKKKHERNNDFFNDFEISIEPVLHTEDSKTTELKLNEAINQLSEVQKEIIFLKFYQNCSLEEIGEILHLQRKSVYNGMFNAMTSLKNKINQQNLLASLLVL